MEYTNIHGLPLPVLRMAQSMEHEVPEAALSVTQLIDTPRRVQLKQRHDAHITVDVMDMVFSLLGTAFHDAMEGHTTAAAENLLTATIDSQLISGKPDRIKNGKITDWKVASAWSYVFGRPEWESQVNVYRWLARANGIIVVSAEIVALFRDWKENQSERNDDYPQSPMLRVPIELWPIDYTERFIRERVAQHREAAKVPDKDLPLCSAEDRWLRGQVWAVYKKASHKRATKLCETEDEAKEYAAQFDDPKIEFRAGENIRCAKYCVAAPFCSQWESLQANAP